MTDEFIMSNCTKCNDCYKIANHMYGCGHNPYKGKWIAEVKKCPKEPICDELEATLKCTQDSWWGTMDDLDKHMKALDKACRLLTYDQFNGLPRRIEVEKLFKFYEEDWKEWLLEDE